MYGAGDADGLSYLASGVLPDWLQYAFGAHAYTLELPPLTWGMGGFSLPTWLIPGACSTAYKVNTATELATDLVCQLIQSMMPIPCAALLGSDGDAGWSRCP